GPQAGGAVAAEAPPVEGPRPASRASSPSSIPSSGGPVARLRDALQKSFLERNQRLIGLVGILALLAGSAFALLLSGGVFARTYHVTAYFSDAAGITPGDHVTVAGLNAGTVTGVRVEKGLVAM